MSDDFQHSEFALLKGIVWNFRDLGSACTEKSELKLRKGLIFRSASLIRGVDLSLVRQLDNSHKEQAERAASCLRKNLNIKVIVDLRSSHEKDCDGYEPIIENIWPTCTTFRSPQGLRRYHVPLLTRSLMIKGLFWPCATATKLKMIRNVTDTQVVSQIFMTESFNDIGLSGLNKLFLTYSAGCIVKILRLCTDPNNFPLMFHCSSGKDRTGLIAALILACCGVCDEDIIANYSQSDRCLGPICDVVIKENRSRGLSESFDFCPPEVMRQTLEYINSQWGSVHHYLNSIGFTFEEQNILRRVLLATESPSVSPHPSGEHLRRTHSRSFGSLKSVSATSSPAMTRKPSNPLLLLSPLRSHRERRLAASAGTPEVQPRSKTLNRLHQLHRSDSAPAGIN